MNVQIGSVARLSSVVSAHWATGFRLDRERPLPAAPPGLGSGKKWRLPAIFLTVDERLKRRNRHKRHAADLDGVDCR